MFVPVGSVEELKRKIKACQELGIEYKLTGKIKRYDIDDSFFKEDGTIYCSERDILDVYDIVPRNSGTPRDDFTKKHYNFDNKNLRFKSLNIAEDVEGKVRQKQDFIITNTHYGKGYFKPFEETELQLITEKERW